MNTLFKILVLKLFPLIVISQEAEKVYEVKSPFSKESSYLITSDSTQVSSEIATKVVTKLGFSEYKKGNTSISIFYRGKENFSSGFETFFSVHKYKPLLDIKLKLNDSLKILSSDTMYYIYGFTTSLKDGPIVDENYSKFLMSAYRQEIDKEYFENENNFTKIIEKDRSKFSRCNWLNMGYGMSYLAKDNPFMGGKKFAIISFYIVEAAHYIPIFGGPFFGRTQKDKILIPFIGISSLILWKGTCSVFLGKRYLKINKAVHDSGYKVPINLEY
jgi:hypothetical protein